VLSGSSRRQRQRRQLNDFDVNKPADLRIDSSRRPLSTRLDLADLQELGPPKLPKTHPSINHHHQPSSPTTYHCPASRAAISPCLFSGNSYTVLPPTRSFNPAVSFFANRPSFPQSPSSSLTPSASPPKTASWRAVCWPPLSLSEDCHQPIHKRSRTAHTHTPYTVRYILSQPQRNFCHTSTSRLSSHLGWMNR
jgi:hypothetical protein